MLHDLNTVIVGRLLLVSLVILGAVEDRTGLHTRLLTFTLTPPPGDPSVVDRVHQIVQEVKVPAQRWKTHRSPDGKAIVEFDADVTTPQERELLQRLAALNVHCEARPVAP